MLGFGTVGQFALGQISQPQNANPAIAQASGTGVARGVTPSVSPATLTGVSGTGVARAMASFTDTIGVVGVSGTGVAKAITPAVSPAALTGVSGTGVARGISPVSVETLVVGAAGIGRAGTVLGQSTAPTVIGAAGIGVAGTISTAIDKGFLGAASIGRAGTITVVVSGGGVSTRLIEDRPRDKRRKTGLEPISKRFDPPLPIEAPKLPLPPFSDAPAIAPAITEPDELRELVPRGLLSLQDQIFTAQDSNDIEKFLRGIDQDEQDAADIADVLALLDD